MNSTLERVLPCVSTEIKPLDMSVENITSFACPENKTNSITHGDTNISIPFESTTLGTIHENTTLGSIHENITLGTINKNTTLGTIHENITLGTIHENTTLGTIYENITLGTIHENITLGTILENITYGTILENTTFGTILENSTTGIIDEATMSTDASNISSGNLLMGPIDQREWYKYGFEFEMCGYFLPIIAILVYFMNVTMIKVFVSNNLLSPTNILIGTIAVCDLLTVTMPCAIWFYAFGLLRHHYFIPYEWCRIWHDMAETWPSTIHGVVIVLNVVLVIQRYMLVAFPYKIKYICTRLTTLICILVVVLLFSLPGMFAFFEYIYVPITIPAQFNPNETMTACLVGISSWITTFGMNRYIAVRLFVRAATVFVSCTTATVFCILTLWKCKQISRQRKRLTQNVSSMQRSEVRLTMTTMAIIAAFVSTELPSVIIIALDAFTFMTGTAVIPGNFAYTLSVLNNTLVICTTMLNFLIYFYFSKSFRSACFAFWCCKRKRENTHGKSNERVQVRPGDRKPTSSSLSDSNNSISGNATVSTSCDSSKQDISDIVVHL